MAEECKQWQQAVDYSFNALSTFLQFQNNHNGGIVMGSLVRVWQTVVSGHPAIATSIVMRLAQLFGVSPAEAFLKD